MAAGGVSERMRKNGGVCNDGYDKAFQWRGVGYNSTDVFGAAPCSTGGGVKVTAVYAIFKAIVSYAKGGTRPMVRGRMISPRTVYKSFVLVALAVGVIVFSVFLMSLIEPEVTMDRLMLEVTSAFGTVGFSMGLTPNLHPWESLCWFRSCLSGD